MHGLGPEGNPEDPRTSREKNPFRCFHSVRSNPDRLGEGSQLRSLIAEQQDHVGLVT